MFTACVDMITMEFIIATCNTTNTKLCTALREVTPFCGGSLYSNKFIRNMYFVQLNNAERN